MLSTKSKLTLPTEKPGSMQLVLQGLKNTLHHEKRAKEIATEKLKTRGALNLEAVQNYQFSLDQSLEKIKQYERAIYLIELDLENETQSPGHDEEHF